MKKHLHFLIALSILVFVYSCKTDDPIQITDPEKEDTNWIKLVLTGQQRGVTAVYGDYEDTLIVATLNNLHMTTNKGMSWKQVYAGATGLPHNNI